MSGSVIGGYAKPQAEVQGHLSLVTGQGEGIPQSVFLTNDK
jgi:hypothetical protein